MKKIPTLFERDQETGLVVNTVTPGCEWALNGEGRATRKWDGSCCMVRGGVLFKRYDAKHGKIPPENFEPAQPPDDVTGHWPGWVPVGDGPADQWHREAMRHPPWPIPDGTYELCGPKIGGNPEGFPVHTLIPHGAYVYPDVPRTFDGLRAWLSGLDIEGIVFHHNDGHMCKIKLKDYGLKL